MKHHKHIHRTYILGHFRQLNLKFITKFFTQHQLQDTNYYSDLHNCKSLVINLQLNIFCVQYKQDLSHCYAIEKNIYVQVY